MLDGITKSRMRKRSSVRSAISLDPSIVSVLMTVGENEVESDD